MDEKVLLLMEETGCDIGEAELALELSDNNLEKAISTIRTVLRNIVVIKGKLFIEKENLFGAFIVIIDKRKSQIIRIRSVITFNPSMFEETNLDSDWAEIEKLIYNYRLQEGTVEPVVHEIEKYFHNVIYRTNIDFFQYLEKNNTDKIKKIMFDEFPYVNFKVFITLEELNLAQYQKETNFTSIGNNLLNKNKYPNKLFLEAKILEDNKNGKKASKLSVGETVMAQIIDKRDIAQYIAKLLGKKEDTFLPAKIENVLFFKPDKIELHFSFSSNITGIYILEQNKKIKIVQETKISWAKKLLGLR